MIHFRYLKCPKCNFPLDFHFFGLSTSLGPGEVKCRKCETLFQTERVEWPNLKGRALVVSILSTGALIAFGSLLISNLLFNSYEYWIGIKKPANMPVENLLFQKIWMACALALFIWQLYRIRESLRRCRQNAVVSEEGLFSPSLVFGSQLKLFLIFALIAFFSWLKLHFIF